VSVLECLGVREALILLGGVRSHHFADAVLIHMTIRPHVWLEDASPAGSGDSRRGGYVEESCYCK
jgi:hypothetical protein